MQIFLIRHPRPQVAPDVCYGRSDLTLAEDAESCAAALRRRLPPDAPLYSSPLMRCRLLSERLHPQPIYDERLQEMHFGEWELRRWEDIGHAQIDAWAADPLNFTPPGGESVGTMRRRAAGFLADLRKAGLPSTVIVTHAGILRACAAELLALPQNDWLTLPFDYGTVSLIEKVASPHMTEGEWRLIWHNCNHAA